MIRHHLTDDLLMAYSAGTLPEAFSLIVATHVSLCDDCRARLEAYDAVGGSLLDQLLPQVSMAPDALAATMQKIAMSDAEDARASPPRPAHRVFPEPLYGYVGGDLDHVRWRAVGGGVRQAILNTSSEASARLLYIPGGVAVPDHGHHGMELTLVLQGAFRDEHDRFGPGDIEIATEETQHTPVAEPGLDCICLAVTDAPLKFSGLLPRLAQPFLRI
ncbi:cupin domain-containing protein [Rhodobacteraceae bacterium 2376]|uniref:Cupin domain-containing protein n=1 Tax=Rhabdonatronobacter sediminivivens TaxID=2743469 RepID=A0A7Z0KWR2_9RHOB|nr:ChrR family anti-sigma-E factor [Rhabdonatronobacter sediminivivens]NYS24307.1 cupin domain-containing protein [Rhabdonatronobacter sediminivivens]